MELKLIEDLTWPFFIFNVIVVAYILIRGGTLTSIEIGFGGIKFGLGLRDQSPALQKHAKAKGFGKAASSFDLASQGRLIGLGKQASRDRVIEKWGSLKQVLFTACAVNGVPLPAGTKIPAVLRHLSGVSAIDPDVSFLVENLDAFGQSLYTRTGSRPLDHDAKIFVALVDDIIDWVTANAMFPREEPDMEVLPEASRRPTAVGEYYPPPRSGQPAAWLVGIEGTSRGKRFPVDKEYFRIGSDSGNDLCLKEDDYVSGRHAYLSYENGALFLADLGSRNGTFLNERQVVGTAMMVRRGDHIMIGGSGFQISDSGKPASPSSGSAAPPTGSEEPPTDDGSSDRVVR